jgi:hypothetical protein
MDPIEQIKELFAQIAELAGVGIEALDAATGGGEGGEPKGPPPEGGGGGEPPQGPPPGA